MRVSEFSIDFSRAFATRAATAPELATSRMEAAARLGLVLPPSAPAMSAAEALRLVCDQAVRTLGSASRMSLAAAIPDDLAVSPQKAARLGLIASELLSNAISHAHPAGVFGEISLKCAKAGPDIVLEVCDDGIGLPEDFDPRLDCGRGLRLVRLMGEELGASVRFYSGACGLDVEVRVPAG